jgi:hypothetical protein
MAFAGGFAAGAVKPKPGPDCLISFRPNLAGGFAAKLSKHRVTQHNKAIIKSIIFK